MQTALFARLRRSGQLQKQGPTDEEMLALRQQLERSRATEEAQRAQIQELKQRVSDLEMKCIELSREARTVAPARELQKSRSFSGQIARPRSDALAQMGDRFQAELDKMSARPPVPESGIQKRSDFENPFGSSGLESSPAASAPTGGREILRKSALRQPQPSQAQQKPQQQQGPPQRQKPPVSQQPKAKRPATPQAASTKKSISIPKVRREAPPTAPVVQAKAQVVAIKETDADGIPVFRAQIKEGEPPVDRVKLF